MEQCCSNNGKNGCACQGTCQVCNPHTCHPKEGEEGHGEEMTHLLAVADSAWMEVLKDKIKEHILATENERMTELAKLLAEGNHARWKLKMVKKQGCMEFKEKLCRFFGSKK